MVSPAVGKVILVPFDEVGAEYHGKHHYVCPCGRCSQPFLIRQSLSDSRQIRDHNRREDPLREREQA
jgi:hypothetical protein